MYLQFVGAANPSGMTKLKSETNTVMILAIDKDKINKAKNIGIDWYEITVPSSRH